MESDKMETPDGEQQILFGNKERMFGFSCRIIDNFLTYYEVGIFLNF